MLTKDFEILTQQGDRKMNNNNLNNASKEWINDLHVGTKSQIVKNPYSKESMELTPLEVAVYDFIKGCEFMGMNVPMSWGISWFIDNNPEAYQTLLN